MMEKPDHFSDWYRLADMGVNRETHDLRRRSVQSITKGMDTALAWDLIRLVFGRPAQSSETIAQFRQAFRDADSTFPMSGNDNEMAVLEGCVLGTAMTKGDDFGGKVGTAVLAASACATRVPHIAIDLLEIAKQAVANAAASFRRRPSSYEIKLPNFSKQQIEELIHKIEEQPDFTPVIEAMKQIVVQIANAFDGSKSLRREALELRRLLAIQDEELQMLWWLVGGWSQIYNVQFKSLPRDAKPILLAKEIADLTVADVEPPALKALLSRAGISSSASLTIPEAVNACGDERLSTMTPPSTPCTTLLPVHTAISRAIETGCGDTWIAGWNAITGIADNTQVKAIDLAIQVHRERMLFGPE